jgi:hypothetical protein
MQIGMAPVWPAEFVTERIGQGVLPSVSKCGTAGALEFVGLCKFAGIMLAVGIIEHRY